MATLRHTYSLHLLLLCAVLTILGCTGKQAEADKAEETETVRNARHNLQTGLEYDGQRHQMRLAELYYRKSYEILRDDPSQDWYVYADAGYRYACLLRQRGDMEGALTIATEVLKKAEGNEDFPVAHEAFLRSLMAECQLALAMPEAAKQNYAKAYERQLTVLGGEQKGDLNLAVMCINIFQSFIEMGDYDEAGKWLSRYEEEFRVYERSGDGDSLIISEHHGLLALYKAQLLQATGRAKDAAAVYAAIDSAIAWQKQSDAAELAVIYQTNEKDMQLANQRFTISLHRLFAAGLVIILLLNAGLLWRSYIYNKVLLAKNRHLLAEIEKQERKERQAIKQLNAEPEDALTVSQQLYRRLCTIMAEQQPYTNKSLNRDTLAQLLGTNAKYVEQAIRECSYGETVGNFITRYRLEHVARLLKTTDDSISLIGEQSGIPSRATLARIFRNAYGMTCSEYRQAVKSKATEGPISSE